MSKSIPISSIGRIAENRHATYFQVGHEVTVRSWNDKRYCLTCHKYDCPHTDVVDRYQQERQSRPPLPQNNFTPPF
jgi:hypothetical protein